LAQAALLLQEGTDPLHALGRLGVVLATLAAVMTKSFLQKTGVNLWAATACGALIVVVPQCIRAFSIAEVYALDMMLLAMTFWACQRGHTEGRSAWTALGISAAILSTGHRPINAVLLVGLVMAWPQFRADLKGVAAGIGSGATIQGLLYWDLWTRIKKAEAVWIDEHVQATAGSFSRFVAGLPFEQFLVWTDNPLAEFNPMSLGVQCLGLLTAALVVPLAGRGSRLSWGLWLISIWHLVFLLFFRVSDRAFFVFPVIWVGAVALAWSTLRVPQDKQRHLGALLLAGTLGLSAVNKAGLPDLGHDGWREPLRAVLHGLPKDAVILTDDWRIRTGLVAIREIEEVGPTKSVVRISLDGGDIQRLKEWFDGKIPLVLLEERGEIEDLRPVRVHDARLLPLLIEQGMITEPAEAGTWSVELDNGSTD